MEIFSHFRFTVNSFGIAEIYTYAIKGKCFNPFWISSKPFVEVYASGARSKRIFYVGEFISLFNSWVWANKCLLWQDIAFGFVLYLHICGVYWIVLHIYVKYVYALWYGSPSKWRNTRIAKYKKWQVVF